MPTVATPSPLPLPLPEEDELHAIARTFYDKVYAHPWIGRFFQDVDQGRQELKLVRFFLMSWHDRSFGPMQGEYLRDEHAHMYITAALFDLRQALFAEAVREHGHDEALVEAFLEFNERWRPYVVKSSIEDCIASITGEVLVVAPPPS